MRGSDEYGDGRRVVVEGAEECSGDRVWGVGGEIYNIFPKI